MVVIDLVAACALCLFVYLGYRRGPAAPVAGLLGILCSYAVARLLFRPLGGWVGKLFEAPPLIDQVAGFAVAFTLALAICFALLAGLVIYRARSGSGPETGQRSTLSRSLGAVAGGCFGLGLLASALWIVNLAQLTPAGRNLPEVGDTVSGRASSAMVRTLAQPQVRKLVADPDLSRSLARWIGDPGGTARNLEAFFRHPKVVSLSRDSGFQSAALDGNPEALLANPAFNLVMDDPETSALIRDLGLLPGGDNPENNKSKAAEKIADIGKSLRKLYRNRKVMAIFNDPVMRSKLVRMDVKWLLKEPRFHRLVEMVLEMSAPDPKRPSQAQGARPGEKS